MKSDPLSILSSSDTFSDSLSHRRLKAVIFKRLCTLVAFSAIAILFILLFRIVSDGVGWLSFDFLQNYPSRFPHKAGIKSALFGSLWLMSFTALIAIPVGVLAAVYLEEYAPKNGFTRIIDINIANLAGVPSIVYGILGLAIFVRFLGLERSVLAGALTMSLLILPIIVISSKEALKSVPSTIRLAAYAVGATRWQVTRHHVIPFALPGVLTGVILALSRAIGETAPLIMIGALTYVAFTPEGPMDEFTALPIQIFNWTSRPQEDFHHLAAAGIMVLLFVLIVMNGIAVYIRHKGSHK